MKNGIHPDGYIAKKKKTNADRIRSMTDEGLAKWFDAVTKDILGGSTWDKKGWLKWLRAESEGQHGEINICGREWRSFISSSRFTG